MLKPASEIIELTKKYEKEANTIREMKKEIAQKIYHAARDGKWSIDIEYLPMNVKQTYFDQIIPELERLGYSVSLREPKVAPAGYPSNEWYATYSLRIQWCEKDDSQEIQLL